MDKEILFQLGSTLKKNLLLQEQTLSLKNAGVNPSWKYHIGLMEREHEFEVSSITP